MMNHEHLEAILIECLEALEAGATVEELLARYPAEAAQLGPALRVAARLSGWGDKTRSAAPVAFAQERSAFLARAALMSGEGRLVVRLGWFLRSRLVMSLLVALAVLIAIGGGVFGVSAASVPGDPLYGVKRSFEDIQLSFARDPVQRVNMEETFLKRRVEEVRAVQSARRAASIEFAGPVEAREGQNWEIGGFVVQVTSDTLIKDSPRVGSLVEVTGHTLSDGQIIADRIETEGVNFAGVVQGMNAPVWIIGDKRVTVSKETRITGTARLGARVEVHAQAFPDDTLLALKIEFDDSDLSLPGKPTATPQPNSTPTLPHKREPTRAPEATETAEPDEMPQPTRTPSPHKTDEPGETPEPTHPPEPTHLPGADRTPEPTHAKPTHPPEPRHTPKPTHSPEATGIPEPGYTPGPTEAPDPTRRSEPTEAPEPTKIPEP